MSRHHRNRNDPRLEIPDEEALLAELFAVFAEAEGLLAGWTCPASTECCRFGITGREPYVTSIELAAVKRELARIGGPRAFRHAAPLAAGARAGDGEAGASDDDDDARRAARSKESARGGGKKADRKRRLTMATDERTCPLLNEEGRCAVYAARPLGCRTFFCERASSPLRERSTRGRVLPQRELNDLVQRIRAIAGRHTAGGDLGRALTNALGAR